MTTGARVTLGGAAVASGWDGTDLIAVDGISIRWGRARPYDDPDPSILTLTLLDRTGQFASDPDRIGQEVVVEMIDPATVTFRGTITKPRARRVKVHNPSLNALEVVWLVTITATDPIAALGMAVFPGDAVDGWVEGAGGWSEVTPNQRLQKLYDAGASGLVAGFAPLPDIVASPAVDRRVHGQAAKDARSALDLVQQVYRGDPLAVAVYDPSAHSISIGRFAASSAVRLVVAGGVVKLDLPAGRVVPASRVRSDSYTLESDVDQAIDAVQVSYYWYGKDPTLSTGEQKRTIYTEGFIEGRTARYDARTRRVLKIATEFITFDPSEFVAGSRDAFNRFPAWLRDQVLAIVNKLNGQLTMPTLTFDAKRLPLPAELEALIYRPVQPNVPIYFSGSIFNGLEGVGPQFQIIGGTLTYRNGWQHAVTVCATGPAADGLTLGALFGMSDAKLTDLDPDISLADLGLVTNGLA
jgi:hypothetical protein